jgi:hypothetical protein
LTQQIGFERKKSKKRAAIRSALDFQFKKMAAEVGVDPAAAGEWIGMTAPALP